MDPEEVPSNASTPFPTESPSKYDIYERIDLEFYTIISLLSVISNVLLLIAIVKFKKLRNVTNIILALFCTLQIFLSLFVSVYLRVFHNLAKNYVTDRVYSVLNNIGANVMYCMCLLLVLLLTDWYIKVYKQHNYGKFKQVYSYVIGLIYVCLSCAVLLSIFSGEYMISVLKYMGLAFGLFLMIYLIVLNIIHAVKKRQVRTDNTFNLGLIVCNITYLYAFPRAIASFLAIFQIEHPVTNILFELIGCTSPVVMSIYLYKYEEDFNVFMRKIVTCKCEENKNEELQEDRVLINPEDA